MKIFIVGTAYPLRGGIAHYVALLYQQLTAMGHAVEIISFKRQYPRWLFPGKTQADQSQAVVPIPAKPLIDSINPFTWFKTFRYIYHARPELVIYKYWLPFFAPCYGTIVLLTRLFTKTKSLFIGDNIVPHEKIPLVDWALTHWALCAVDYFIVQSAAVRRDLLTFKPQANFAEIPHPVYEIFQENYTQSQARQRLNLAARERVLLFFGYVRPYKGLNYLLDALPEVLAEMPVKLLIAGEFYADEAQYRQQIEQLGLWPHVLLKSDYIPNEEVGLYYAAADVVVLPYITATQSGIVQIAYHYNKPVITTNAGGLPEVIAEGRTGFIVPTRDSKALARAITHFFKVRETIDFAQNIAEHKKQYSWERLAQAIIHFVTP